MAKNRRRTRRKRAKRSRHQVIRIDVLPDDVLLQIFDFYMNRNPARSRTKTETEAWQSLVHVCRRWRVLVFESPRRLNLQLFCTPKTPTRDKLDLWPALPLLIVIDGAMASESQDLDNIIVALEQSNRVCQVMFLGLAGWRFEKVLATMQMPFPELTNLQLASNDETVPVIPDSFLDGSAQRLQYFMLDSIPFPGLPKLLLSATNLVSLWLSDIPHSGYFSPEAMVALISASSSLERLFFAFRSPQSRPNWESRRWPPSKRSVIPALEIFRFKGVIEYLEDLVTFIDAPQLNALHITFFNQIDFDFPRLAQFINRTPTISPLDEAHVEFNDSCVSVGLPPDTGILEIEISCREPDWQLSSIEQVCNSSLHPISTAEDLYIEHEYSQLVWKNDAIENTLWLQLLLPFTAVKDLYLSKEFAPGIAAALQELVGARITEVLPSLENIFMEGLEPSGPLQESIGRFVAARLLSDRPIAVSAWDKDSDMLM
ncbi:hypothetical protein V8E52_011122 [Russula decolorans]